MTPQTNPLPKPGESWLEGLSDLVEIGRGGHATVYRAHHTQLGRTVAVKRLDGHLVGRDRLRFDRECDALRTLGDHPNICGLIECRVSDDGRAAMVLDHHARGSLRSQLESVGPMTWPTAFRIAASLAGALETSHRAGILHRDVTPSNVLIDKFGAPVLADFGLARRGESVTRTGELRATIEHAPPEAFAGIDPKPSTDIYSLASTVYELIAGHAPMAKDSPAALTLIARLASESPEHIEGVPADVMGVLAIGLAKDPSERFETAAEMAMAYNAALGRHGEQRAVVHVEGGGHTSNTIFVDLPPTPTLSAPPAPGRRLLAVSDQDRSKRRPRRVRALVAATAIAIAGLVFATGQLPLDAPQSQDFAQIVETDVVQPVATTTTPAPPSAPATEAVETTVIADQATPAALTPVADPETGTDLSAPAAPPTADNIRFTADDNNTGRNDGGGNNRGDGGRSNRGN